MDYALIFRLLYNCCGMDSATLDYVKLAAYFQEKMLDMRIGYITCKTGQVGLISGHSSLFLPRTGTDNSIQVT